MSNRLVYGMEIIRPDSPWYTTDNSETYESFVWLGNPEDKPTEEEFLMILEAGEKKSYRVLRAAEYPTIGDQLDSLYHAGIFPQDMMEKIKAVKDKYPKE